jgi:hypothetical protein
VQFDRFYPPPAAQVRILSAEVPWAANSLQNPEAVKPQDNEVKLTDGQLIFELPAFSVARARIPRGL